MSDTRGSAGAVVCDDHCGCSIPCPGGSACGCKSVETEGEAEHSKCSCGEHCGCNPCTCPKSSTIVGVGKAHCKCGDNCNCATCAS